MLQTKLPFPSYSRGLLMLAITSMLWLLPIVSVEAQCGSQASSCKNCHEVQGELPVNNDGTGWHESHAFGDFCYVCHAGNQQVTDEDEAHASMVHPLSDVNASCQMCHAEDLTERAEVYASILDYDLGGSSSADSTSQSDESSDEDASSDESSSGTTQSDESTSTVSQQSTECIALSDELIIDDASFEDYVERYDEIVLGKQPVNMGNVVLGGLIALLVLGGGGYVLVNEIRMTTAHTATGKVEGEYPVDVIEMLPALAALKLQTRKALQRILSNPQKTDQVLGLIDTVISDDDPEEPIQ